MSDHRSSDSSDALVLVVEPRDDVVLVAVGGEVDLSTADQLSAAFLEAAELAGRDGVVVVDLTDVTFMDSSGLNALVKASKQTHVSWRLYGLRPRLRELFLITGLDRAFFLDASSLEEALSARAGRTGVQS